MASIYAGPTALMHDTPVTSSLVPTAPLLAPLPLQEHAADSREPEERWCRVLHLVNGEHFAGAERVQMHLGRGLPRLGVQTDFVTLMQGRFADQFDLPHSQLTAVPMRGRIDMGTVARVASVAEAGNYQLLHAHTPRSAMIAAPVARRLGVPWVYHVHSPAARDSSRRLRNWINALVERMSLRSARHLITVSHSLRNQLLDSGWPEDRVTVVHNGVPSHRAARPVFPAPGQPWTVGMIALMRPRKGLEVALESIARLRCAGYPVTLRCIGPFESPDYEAGIHRLVGQLRIAHAVRFDGFVREVPAALSELSMMILPSLYGEGLPMVVLEAMAAGLPVVATRVEGTPEAIEHGYQGLLAEPGCPDSLARQIGDLISGRWDWRRLSKSAIERHAAQFSDSAMATATAEVYRRVLED